MTVDKRIIVHSMVTTAQNPAKSTAQETMRKSEFILIHRYYGDATKMAALRKNKNLVLFPSRGGGNVSLMFKHIAVHLFTPFTCSIVPRKAASGASR